MMLGKLRGGQLNVGLAETEGPARFHPRPLGARMPAQSTCPRAGSALTYSSKMQPLRDQEPIRTRAWNEARPDSRLFVFATRATGELTELCRTLDVSAAARWESGTLFSRNYSMSTIP